MKKSAILQLFIFICFNININAQDLSADSLALVAIYDNCDGVNWNDSENWLSAPLTEWEGVKIAGNRVTELKLIGKGLKNDFPNEIYNLSGLKAIEYREGNCNWNIDNQIQQLVELADLFLNSPTISIDDMTVFCSMDELRRLTLNRVKGNINIPDCITMMPLTRFGLTNLETSETEIPASIGNFSELQFLFLPDLGLQGEIPIEICELENLRSVSLNDNLLSGELPECYINENTLQVNIQNCGLNGDFPFESIGSGLGIINIYDNEFTGDIGTLPDAPGTYGINFNGNKISGTFDASVFDKEWLLRVLVADNNISGLANWSDFGDRMAELDVVGNRLNFEDLEQVDFSSDVEFSYAPQQNLGKDSTYNLSVGENLTLSCNAGGNNTTYQWYRDGEAIDGAIEASLEFINLQVEDVGTYVCEAANEDFPDLALTTENQNLDITSSSDNILKNGLTIFPNPTTGNVQVEIPGGVELFRLYNTFGQVLLAPIKKTDNTLQIDLTAEIPGVYYLNLFAGNTLFTVKLVKS